MEKIRVKIRRCEDAKTPEYKTEFASGADLCSTYDYVLFPLQVALIQTGICLEIPPGYEAQVRPRSGLSLKKIVIVNSPGTIDSDYRGEVKVPLMNIGNKVFEVERGMRIAQLVFAKVTSAVFEDAKALSDTKRGSGGFGSTGK